MRIFIFPDKEYMCWQFSKLGFDIFSFITTNDWLSPQELIVYNFILGWGFIQGGWKITEIY